MESWQSRLRIASQSARDIASEVMEVPHEFDLIDQVPDPTPEPVLNPPDPPVESIDPHKATPVQRKRNIPLEVYDSWTKRIEARRAKAELEETGRLASVRRWILRGVAVFASLSCATTSTYFSNLWFSDSQPKLVAMIMSITIVATLTTAPELSVSLARKRKFISALIVMAIAVVAGAFSMSSTVGGIYNARTAELRAQNEESGEVDASVAAAAAERSVIQSRIDRQTRTLDIERESYASYVAAISKAIAEGQAPESKAVAALVANRNKSQAAIAAMEKAIAADEAKLGTVASVAATGDVKVVREDFNLWLGKRFGLSQDTMEFIMAAFPAVFIDIIAPTMLVVAFAL